MILGVGIDIVDTKRIERLMQKDGAALCARVFHVSEVQQAANYKDSKMRALFYAKRFAAKEAMSKALGTGIAEGVRFQDIIIYNTPQGKPKIRLEGPAKDVCQHLAKDKNPRIDLSLSDEYPMAIAYVVLSAE